jgi:hypothetical protein
VTPSEHDHAGMVKLASGLSLLAGIWFFVSPWVYGAYATRDAWNAWIIGFLIAVFAGMRFANPLTMTALSWLNCLFGIWAFISPWIYAYRGHTGRFVNSLVVGAVVFLLSIWSATATPHTHTQTMSHT